MADARRFMALGMPTTLASEVARQIEAAISDYTAPAVTAADVAFTPAGAIAATNVQDALEELDAEKT